MATQAIAAPISVYCGRARECGCGANAVLLAAQQRGRRGPTPEVLLHQAHRQLAAGEGQRSRARARDAQLSPTPWRFCSAGDGLWVAALHRHRVRLPDRGGEAADGTARRAESATAADRGAAWRSRAHRHDGQATGSERAAAGTGGASRVRIGTRSSGAGAGFHTVRCLVHWSAVFSCQFPCVFRAGSATAENVATEPRAHSRSIDRRNEHSSPPAPEQNPYGRRCAGPAFLGAGDLLLSGRCSICLRLAWLQVVQPLRVGGQGGTPAAEHVRRLHRGAAFSTTAICANWR